MPQVSLTNPAASWGTMYAAPCYALILGVAQEGVCGSAQSPGARAPGCVTCCCHPTTSPTLGGGAPKLAVCE